MTAYLKQSTAKVISFGVFVDKTTGVDLEIGLVSALDHGTTGILLSKNGGTLTIRNAAVTASTYDAHGCYRVTLDTTDTNTLGTLRVIYTDAATCLPVWMDFEILPAAMWNSLFATSGGNLPNAAADAAGGLPISDAGGLDLDARLDAAITSRMATYTQPTGFLSVTFPAGTVANTTNITAGVITTVTNLTNAPTAGDFTATMKASVNTECDTAISDAGLLTALTYAASYGDIADAVLDESATAHQTAGTVGLYINNIKADTAAILVDTGTTLDGRIPAVLTSDGNMKSDALRWAGTVITATSIPVATAAGAAGGLLISGSNSGTTTLGALTVTGAFTAGSSALPWNAAWDTEVESEANDALVAVGVTTARMGALTDWIDGGRLDLLLDAVKAKTDVIPASPAAVGDIPTVSQIWTTALTEAYRATGATGTASQLLYEILQNVVDFAIVGTTKTAKKIDGTTAKTYALSDAVNPTSITELT